MLRCSLLFAVALAVAPLTAAAQPQADGRDAEARALFTAGQVAFEEGRFENALEYFRRSYELSHRPELLYNIGTCADRLRMDAEALSAFEQFVAARPDAPNRAEIDSRIAVLRRSTTATTATTAATTATATTETTTATTATTETTGRTDSDTSTATSAGGSGGGPSPAPWILVGGGVAVTIAGVILVAVAMSDISSVENAPAGSMWSSVSEAYGRTEALSAAGFVMLGVGLAAAGAGVAWGIAGSSSGSSERAELRIGPGGVSVRGSF